MILLALVALGATPALPPQPVLKACDLIDPGQPFVAFDTQLVRAGDIVRIKPMVSHAWYGDEEVRWDCFDQWAVSDPKIARIDPKKHVLVVSASTPSGSDVRVSATFRATRSVGRESVSTTAHVIARAAQVLTGGWTEVARKDCAGEGVAELIFNPRGGYSFTFSGTMVESMTSGRGAFSWDPATKALMLDGRKGAAMLGSWKDSTEREPTALVIAGIDFASQPPPPPPPPSPPPPSGGTAPAPQQPCTLTFSRVK